MIDSIPTTIECDVAIKIKKLIAINLFFILIGYVKEGRSPIYARDQAAANMVDPLPQVVVLTTIVLGLSVTLLLISIAIKLYEKYGTFDITKINRLKG